MKKKESSTYERVELSPETIDALNVARTMHPWLEQCDYNDLIFKITLEWMKREGEESLNDWLREFF